MSEPAQPPTLRLQTEADGGVTASFGGDWDLHNRLPPMPDLGAVEGDKTPRRLALAADADLRYDSTLVARARALRERALGAGYTVDVSGLPEQIRDLLEQAQPLADTGEQPGPRRDRLAFFVREHAQRTGQEALDLMQFTGDWSLGLVRLVRGRSPWRWGDFWNLLEKVTFSALPIVSLISFLVGLIIAFLGAAVLTRFGAEFAVSYLVGYGMLREMGAVMTAVIMAGRTGAAYAAEIGSMKVNEELDALQTLGLSPVDFIVLPRLLALVIAMPLLTLYANVVGIFGGYLVADLLMGVPSSEFFRRMIEVVGPTDFYLGLIKAFVFGVLVATAGCLRGLQSGSGASAVGEAATRAVVTAITLIIFANALLDWAAATVGF